MRKALLGCVAAAAVILAGATSADAQRGDRGGRGGGPGISGISMAAAFVTAAISTATAIVTDISTDRPSRSATAGIRPTITAMPTPSRHARWSACAASVPTVAW
jgi:hypothetical protein